MKSKRLYNTMEIVKDDNMLYNGFDMIEAEIVGYLHMSYRMLQNS